jgi:hypothetical protein
MFSGVETMTAAETASIYAEIYLYRVSTSLS